MVEEEGAERASYALKLLQSEGELMIASTGKDVSSGRLVTQTYRVGDPSTNAPEVLQSTEVRHVEAIAWGTGAKSQLLADWHKKKKSAVEMPNIKLPE